MKSRMPLAEAREIAAKVVQALAPFCERIEVAGSVRRGKAEVGDIEIVAIPKPTFDMFGFELPDHALDLFPWETLGRLVAGGHKYKKIILHEGPQLDLFVVTPPAQWGVIFFIRTGDADFSHKAVTPRMHGGRLPSHLQVKGGAIWNGSQVVPTPEEADVFALLEMDYMEPWQRNTASTPLPASQASPHLADEHGEMAAGQ